MKPPPRDVLKNCRARPRLVGGLRRAGAAHSARVAWQGFRGGTTDGARDLDQGMRILLTCIPSIMLPAAPGRCRDIVRRFRRWPCRLQPLDMEVDEDD